MMIFEKLKAVVASRHFFILILATYLVACLYKLNVQGASKDELTTYGNMLMSLPEMFAHRLGRGHVPFYFVALKVWTLVFGTSHTAMIMFSVTLGWLCLWGVATLARLLGWGRYGWALAAIMAVHPTFLQFARYCRPWMGVACIGVWIMVVWVLMFHESPGSRRLRWLVCWCLIAMVGAGWNHLLLTVWVVLGIGTLLSPTLRRRADDSIWLGIGFGIFVHIFMTGLTLANGRGADPVSWIPHLTPAGVYSLLDDWFGGLLNENVAPLLTDLLPIVFLSLCLYGGLRLYFYRRPRFSYPPSVEQSAMWRVVAAAGWLPLLVLLISNYTTQPLMVFRYGFLAFPGLILLAGYGTWMLPWRHSRMVVLSLWFVGAIAAYPSFVSMRRTAMRLCLKAVHRQLDPKLKEVVFTTPGHGYHAVHWLLPGVEIVLTAPTLPLKEAWPMVAEISHKVDRIWVYELWDQRGLATLPGWDERMGTHSYRYRGKGCRLLRYDFIGSGMYTRAEDMPTTDSMPMMGFDASMEYIFDKPATQQAADEAAMQE